MALTVCLGQDSGDGLDQEHARDDWKVCLTFARLSSKSFFLNRGFCSPCLVFPSQIWLCARTEVGNATTEEEGVLCKPDSSGLTFLGGNLAEMMSHWIYRNEMANTHLSRGSCTLNPMTIPRGSEPDVCRLVRDDQNCGICCKKITSQSRINVVYFFELFSLIFSNRGQGTLQHLVRFWTHDLEDVDAFPEISNLHLKLLDILSRKCFFQRC